MKVLLVLGHGHPGHGMGDSPGRCSNWLRYIDTIARLAENVDVIVFAGGPIFTKAGSMYRWLGYSHERISRNTACVLETQSLVTFENFEFSEQILRGYDPITELTILGAHHKQIGYFFLGSIFFPNVAITNNLHVKTQALTSNRQFWKDIRSVLWYMLCL
ncbi:MAG: ElyC/SanA/YdcF family protein, partial [Candidatus Paceibacteria bacterium]